jgi:hypothetical protein
MQPCAISPSGIAQPYVARLSQGSPPPLTAVSCGHRFVFLGAFPLCFQWCSQNSPLLFNFVPNSTILFIPYGLPKVLPFSPFVAGSKLCSPRSQLLLKGVSFPIAPHLLSHMFCPKLYPSHLSSWVKALHPSSILVLGTETDSTLPKNS